MEPSTRAQHARLPRWVGPVAVVVAAAAVARHLAVPGEGTYLGVGVAAAALAWLGALRHAPRRTLVLIAMGVTASAAGDIAYAAFDWLGRPTPDVSIADVGWLGAYGFIVAAILQLLRRGDGRRDIDGLIDAAVVVVLAMALQWELGLDALVSDTSVSASTRFVWMLYPALDSVLLALVARAVLARRLRGARATVFATGAACWLAADFVYSLSASASDYATVLDAGWLVGALLLGLATWQSAPDVAGSTDDVEALEQISLGRLIVALAPMLVPGGIAAVRHLQGSSAEPIPLLLLSVALVALAFARAVRLLQSEAALRSRLRSQEQYASALAHNSSDAVAVLDMDGRILNDASAFAALLGFPELKPKGLTTADVLEPAAQAEVLAMLARARTRPGEMFEAETKATHRDGRDLWLGVRIVNLLDDPDVGGVVVNVHDVTERRRAQEELAHQAFHDGLTGLANRALFADRVEQALRRSARSGMDAAVIFLDLDGFKTVNDSLGHGPGDELLRQVAARLSDAVRQADTVARLGGDEFAILIEQSPHPVDEAETVADRILSALSAPCVISGQAVTVSASLGIAIGGPEATAGSLLRDADVAMYRAKTSGKARWAIYDPDMRTAAVERLQLETDLIAALDAGQMQLVYQPVVELETERIVGFEALLRWHHPTLGVVAPDRFIPIAEDTGLIVPIGAWVLQEACATAARWHREYPDHADLTMAINVSGRQIASPLLLGDVAAALADSGLDPAKVVLEMTETALVGDTAMAAKRLHELRDLGVKLAIDDFGTGYSSLSYLRQFPVDILKIDRSFIDSIGDRDAVPAIVRGLLDLGRTLELETVAEGVERGNQRDRLRDESCEYAQGFLFARPMEPEDAEAMLMQLEAHPTAID